METTKLLKIGLTPGEIKVYLALIKYGSQSKTPLSAKANVSSSKVYEIIGKLTKKGLTSSFKKNNVTHYAANDPTFLIKYIEEKEKELQEEKEIVNNLLPELKELKEKSIEEVSFELQEGWKGMQNAIMQGLKNTPKNSTVYGIGTQLPKPEFLNNFHKERLKKNIKLKIILSEPIDKKQDYKNTKIKIMPEISEVSMGIYPDRVLIQTPDSPPLNLTIRHPRIIKSFRNIHESLWKVAK